MKEWETRVMERRREEESRRFGGLWQEAHKLMGRQRPGKGIKSMIRVNFRLR